MRHFWVRISAGLCEHPASPAQPRPPDLIPLPDLAPKSRMQFGYPYFS